ncbi:antiterminator Q family protein [Pantoea sp. LMR881]|uniref:antiterminator Q family protein n=1 Tax=Pantoea sp. LMR881 TaxID=3014336 RepID=UPI0022AFEE06|nr:antiterminator Q family protein [Pantoea sp. LMR881]MCZ4058202.1 antiterminator Q family protein [Pantoea sp. LMR881]
MRDIQMVLERWGAWATSGDTNIGYPRTAAGLSRLLPASRAGRPSCCDDDGMFINEAMIRLSKHDEYLCAILEKYYIDGMTLRGWRKCWGSLTTLFRCAFNKAKVLSRVRYALSISSWKWTGNVRKKIFCHRSLN